jgi:hypothetical protein
MLAAGFAPEHVNQCSKIKFKTSSSACSSSRTKSLRIISPTSSREGLPNCEPI